MFFSKSKNVVGLDIGSSAIKLVELKDKKGGNYSLVKLGAECLSPEAIVDGSIMDSSMVVETIQRLNTEGGLAPDRASRSGGITSGASTREASRQFAPCGSIAHCRLMHSLLPMEPSLRSDVM